MLSRYVFPPVDILLCRNSIHFYRFFLPFAYIAFKRIAKKIFFTDAALLFKFTQVENSDAHARSKHCRITYMRLNAEHGHVASSPFSSNIYINNSRFSFSACIILIQSSTSIAPFFFARFLSSTRWFPLSLVFFFNFVRLLLPVYTESLAPNGAWIFSHI